MVCSVTGHCGLTVVPACQIDIRTQLSLRSRRVTRRRLFAAALICVAGLASPFAAAGVPANQVDLVNYAFATQLGTGLYRGGQQDVQVYRLPVAFTLREGDATRSGVKLTLPVTVGFYDFEAVNLFQGEGPRDVTTFGLAVGIEYAVATRSNWTLWPFAELGAGTHVSGSQSAYVYSAGLRARYTLELDSVLLGLGGQLQNAGYQSRDGSLDEDFTVWTLGAEIGPRTGINLGHVLTDGRFYFVNYFYSDDLKFLRFQNEPFTVNVQREIGFTVGTRERVGWFDAPRAGLGYRFGDGLEVLRLVLGVPF